MPENGQGKEKPEQSSSHLLYSLCIRSDQANRRTNPTDETGRNQHERPENQNTQHRTTSISTARSFTGFDGGVLRVSGQHSFSIASKTSFSDFQYIIF